jgi:hypothetical protein
LLGDCGSDPRSLALDSADRLGVGAPHDFHVAIAQVDGQATYADYDDFVYGLPKFIADVTRRLEERIQQTEGST